MSHNRAQLIVSFMNPEIVRSIGIVLVVMSVSYLALAGLLDLVLWFRMLASGAVPKSATRMAVIRVAIIMSAALVAGAGIHLIEPLADFTLPILLVFAIVVSLLSAWDINFRIKAWHWRNRLEMRRAKLRNGVD